MPALQTHTHTHTARARGNTQIHERRAQTCSVSGYLIFHPASGQDWIPRRGEHTRRRQQNIINKHTNVPESAANLLFACFSVMAAVLGCSFYKNGQKKRSPKQYQSVFITPDMNYSPKPSERFRRKYFLWMCLRECVHCRQKTKLGAIYFLHSTVS